MRKLFSLFTVLTLSVGLWAETVEYLYPVYNTNGDAKSGIKEWKTDEVEATIVTSSDEAVTWGTAGQNTWYVVKGEDVQLSKGAVCAGAVNLILANGAKLTATGWINESYKRYPGIQVSGDGNSLTIYGQSTVFNAMGLLEANSGDNAAGIGGGDSEHGSNITINGGRVKASSVYTGAGIGGGSNANGFNIIINGGSITANGGYDGGAGIGGGQATQGTKGYNIIINGGEINANGGKNGDNDAAGIGDGAFYTEKQNSGSDIFINTACIIKVDDSNPPTTVIDNDGTDLAGKLKRYTTIGTTAAPESVETTYIDENGDEQNITANPVPSSDGLVLWGTAGTTSWYIINDTHIQLTQGAICVGDVRLILADDAKLTATGITRLDGNTAGIQVSSDGNSLTIYGQANQSGQLEANGGMYAAGIGGGYNNEGKNITINGGKVSATGGTQAAGIGGGYGEGGYGSNITINRGEIMAIGGANAAGIGGGLNGSGSNITINGGKVIANGGYSGIGKGIGASTNASDIYISDAYVLNAGEDADETEVIAHSSATDMASSLKKKYVKIEGLATPYTRTMSVDQWGTICLPYAATSFEGAIFYKLNYFDGVDKLYVEEVSSLDAGTPYVFQATAETVIINHGGVATLTGEELTERGLYGSVARTIIESDGDVAAIANNQVNVVEDGNKVTVPACRAYLDMSQVPTNEQPASAPLRCIGVPRQSPSGLEQSVISNQQSAIKVLKGGQLMIVKEGKTYNAQGIEIQ